MPRATSDTPDSDFIVDDSSALIKYNTSDSRQEWLHFTPSNTGSGIDVYYNSTFSYSMNSTSFDFEFTGTRVAVYGSFARPSSPDVSEYVGTTSVYTVDGTNNVTYTTPFQTTIRRYTRFYQSDLLPYGKHILHVDVLSGMDYELDWIEYNVTVPMTSSSSLSSTTSSPSTISAPEPTSPSESTPSPSPTPSSGSSAADATEASSKGSVNVGAAVGGAIGGLALLSLGAIVAYLLWRKRRAPNRSTGMGGSVETDFTAYNVHSTSPTRRGEKSAVVA